MTLFNEYYDSDKEAFEHFDSFVGKEVFFCNSNKIYQSKLTHYENPSHTSEGSDEGWTTIDKTTWYFQLEIGAYAKVRRNEYTGKIHKLMVLFLTQEEAEVHRKNILIHDII